MLAQPPTIPTIAMRLLVKASSSGQAWHFSDSNSRWQRTLLNVWDAPCPAKLERHLHLKDLQELWGRSSSLENMQVLSGPVRDTPHRAIPFRDSIAEGGIAPICLLFIGYCASIAEIPLLRGGIAPPLRMLSKGETLRKEGGGIAPNWPCWDTKNPLARNGGVSLR